MEWYSIENIESAFERIGGFDREGNHCIWARGKYRIMCVANTEERVTFNIIGMNKYDWWKCTCTGKKDMDEFLTIISKTEPNKIGMALEQQLIVNMLNKM